MPFLPRLMIGGKRTREHVGGLAVERDASIPPCTTSVRGRGHITAVRDVKAEPI